MLIGCGSIKFISDGPVLPLQPDHFFTIADCTNSIEADAFISKGEKVLIIIFTIKMPRFLCPYAPFVQGFQLDGWRMQFNRNWPL